MLLKIIKPLFFLYLGIIYLLTFVVLFNISFFFYEYETNLKIKLIVIICCSIYFTFLINYFLIPKFFYKKTFFISIIWGAILNLITLGFSFIIAGSFYIAGYINRLDLKLKNTFKIINSKIKLDINYIEFEKGISVLIYSLLIILLINIIIYIFLIKKHKVSKNIW